MSDFTPEKITQIQNLLFDAVFDSTLIGLLFLGIYFPNFLDLMSWINNTCLGIYTFIYCGTMYLCCEFYFAIFN